MRGLLVLALLTLAMPVKAETIRIWGTNSLQPLAERWAEAFEREHPEVHFQIAMIGSDSAIHGLVGGVADIALMARENDLVDDNGFSRPKQYPVTRIEIAMRGEPIAVLVHRDNPLSALTREQLGRILDCGDQHRPINTWGDLGLTGAWAKAPIRVHSYSFATRTGAWIQSQVTGNDRRMCWDRITEYPSLNLGWSAALIATWAKQDRYALVIAKPDLVRSGFKLVPLDVPLLRRAYAFVDRAPGKRLPPHVQAFLQFALSQEGQKSITADLGYAPLDPANAAAQRGVLEGKP